ncbi:MAG: sulfatase [Proteobacteria bacterium]|nr:sulfatase [Pseudomonadota bacterium]
MTLSVLLGGRRRLDDTWRVTGNRFSGEGFALRAGEAYEREVAIPAASRLRFATTVEPALLGESAEDVPVRFRVLLDGQTVFEHAAPDPGREAFAWHEVVLPAEGRSSARVRFEVDGGLAHSAFLAPVIGPAEVGAPGARLWTRRHPDIVLFLADTFRADNLQAYGGELSLTPFLDRLAGESLLFTRAWSASTHTLPAHAALFSGFYPHQVGVRDETTVLPDAVSTIAEHLSAAGYRTGAITDAVVVSDHRGLSQGFEWFDERQIGIRSTAERTRAFLDADDGRPVFLFIQTYRTHLPYRVSAATARQHGERLGIEQWNEPLQRELVARTRGASSLDDPAVARLVEKLQARYRGGVIDLDRALEGIVADLRARGMLANGYFVFTSDHGEAFGEHNVLYHQGTVWEELISVPLFIVGAGIEPGRIDAAASLVDLAPTLVEMAGRPPDPDWPGSSLLALGTLEDRPAFAFQATRRERSTVALIEGPHKLIGFEDPAALEEGRLLGAYELDRDPGERRNVAGKGDAWPAELMERLGPQARDLLTPRIDPEPALLDVERVDELRAMGYVE